MLLNEHTERVRCFCGNSSIAVTCSALSAQPSPSPSPSRSLSPHLNLFRRQHPGRAKQLAQASGSFVQQPNLRWLTSRPATAQCRAAGLKGNLPKSRVDTLSDKETNGNNRTCQWRQLTEDMAARLCAHGEHKVKDFPHPISLQAWQRLHVCNIIQHNAAHMCRHTLKCTQVCA